MNRSTEIIIMVIIFAIVFFISGKVEKILRKICRTLEKWYGKISKPLDKLVGAVCDAVSGGVRGMLQGSRVLQASDRMSAFGGLGMLLFFFGALLFVVACGVYFVGDNRGMSNLIESVVFGTTMGSMFSLLNDGFAFDLPTMVGAGFSGFLAMVCMRKCSDVNKIVSAVYNLVFIAMSSILGMLMGDLFRRTAEFGVSLFKRLLEFFVTENELSMGNLFIGIGSFLLLPILLYLALLVLVITAKEYAAILCYGLRALLILLALCVPVSEFLSEYTMLTGILIPLIFFGVLIYAEEVRAKEEESGT